MCHVWRLRPSERCACKTNARFSAQRGRTQERPGAEAQQLPRTPESEACGLLLPRAAAKNPRPCRLRLASAGRPIRLCRAASSQSARSPGRAQRSSWRGRRARACAAPRRRGHIGGALVTGGTRAGNGFGGGVVALQSVASFFAFLVELRPGYGYAAGSPGVPTPHACYARLRGVAQRARLLPGACVFCLFDRWVLPAAASRDRGGHRATRLYTTPMDGDRTNKGDGALDDVRCSRFRSGKFVGVAVARASAAFACPFRFAASVKKALAFFENTNRATS